MKKKIIIGILILTLVVVMIVFNVTKNSDGESKLSFGNKAYEVDALTIEAMNIESTVALTGRVEEVNKKEVILPSQVVINKWLVKKGDRVKKGDQLMEADLTSFEEQLQQLQRSKEEQNLQLSKLQSLSTSSDTTNLDIAVELATLNLESAKVLYTSSQAAYMMNETLFQEGIISQSELEGHSKKLKDAETQVTVAELNQKRSEAELKAYKQNISSSQQSTSVDIEIQNKRLEEIEFNILNLTEDLDQLKAAMLCPMDGVVTQINIAEGMMASAMQAVLIIVDTSELKVVADVGEYDIRKMALDQKVKLTGDAIKEDVAITGTLHYIEPIAIQSFDAGKEGTTIAIEIAITSGSEHLKPGYTLECEVTTEAKELATVANYDMFKEDKDGSKYVFVIDENGLLRKQIVTLGIVSDFTAEIVEGLKPGDLVVVNPSLTLKEGAKVKVKKEV